MLKLSKLCPVIYAIVISTVISKGGRCWSAVFPYLVGQRSPALWGFMVGHPGLSFVVCSVLMIILAARLKLSNMKRIIHTNFKNKTWIPFRRVQLNLHSFIRYTNMKIRHFICRAILKIAEVVSRIEDIDTFVKSLCQLGFQLQAKVKCCKSTAVYTHIKSIPIRRFFNGKPDSFIGSSLLLIFLVHSAAICF